MAKLGEYKPQKINKLQALKDRKEAMKPPSPSKVRKAYTIDLEEVYRLARNMLGQSDIAIKMGFSPQAFATYIEQRPEILEEIERGQSDTRNDLRRVQLDLAMSGHPSMLMWLGKQYLGQADKHEQKVNTEINITVQRAMEELRGIPRGQLLEAHKLIEGASGGDETDEEGS